MVRKITNPRTFRFEQISIVSKIKATKRLGSAWGSFTPIMFVKLVVEQLEHDVINVSSDHRPQTIFSSLERTSYTSVHLSKSRT